MNNREKGSCNEDLAASFFKSLGYRILERNYRRKTGEIDIIAEDRGTLVFAEVKYRKKTLKGHPFEAVNGAKQARIYRTAEWYLTEKNISFSHACRFDVVSILDGKVTHFINAFGGL